jgi:hypothetical protein
MCIKIYMGHDEEMGKVMKVFEDYGVFSLIESQELRTIKGDALGELVKCKLSKPFSKPKFLEKLDIS